MRAVFKVVLALVALVGVRGCPNTCKGRSCEDWFTKDGLTCWQLEIDYGCDCKGCAGCHKQDCMASCYGKTCDQVTAEFVTTCKTLEDTYKCDCKGCKCWETSGTASPTCKAPCQKADHKGDGYCDDLNNICGCAWDGGDCCGNQNKYTLCTDCKCKEKAKVQAGCQGHCGNPAWADDKICDDSNNNCGCAWDGGDCCNTQARKNSFKFCKECRCRERDQQGKATFTAGCNGNCKNPGYKGDKHCDDANNNCGCNWDGGDCCGSSAGVSFCTKCKCLDPNFDGSKCKGTCADAKWKGDKVCDDGNNNCGCNWDGGDCCGGSKSYNYCNKCSCLDKNFKPSSDDQSAPGGCAKYTSTPRYCKSFGWKGDGYCDSRNNICGCNWDGGDCCGSGFSAKFCDPKVGHCTCVDPSFGNHTKPAESTCAQSPKSNCKYPQYQQDQHCDDLNNVCACNWDGGDCCGKTNIFTYCDNCKCADPAKSKTGCQRGCWLKQYVADQHCDDKNNNCGCNWDGGDCCHVPDGKVRSFKYCKSCLCLDPVLSKKANCQGNCRDSRTWKGDSHCDDGNNNCGCDWDGGDCCGATVSTKYCKDCLCKDPSKTGGTSCSRVFAHNSACSLKNILGTPTVWISEFKCALKCVAQNGCAYFDNKGDRCRLFTDQCHYTSKRAKKPGNAKVFKLETCS